MNFLKGVVCVFIGTLLCLAGSNACAQNYKQPTKKQTQQDTTTTIEQKSQRIEQKTDRIEQKGERVEQSIQRSADLEIDGLIVDETITKIGRDFYDIFHRQWEAPANSSNFTILIQEKPTRSNGAYVIVSVNDEPIFEYNLQPRYDTIEEVANYTVTLVYEYLVSDNLNKQLEAEGKKAREVY
ncbi:CsgE family curli-type amyloid fiber assembly protein [Pontibacter sp. H259]|uniref:CsgE family curli-type amyloid fiber assembly protein n=1 Tax=Pontibacter sp. H259 TaxID=3133421 RepID=UPI0030BBD804